VVQPHKNSDGDTYLHIIVLPDGNAIMHEIVSGKKIDGFSPRHPFMFNPPAIRINLPGTIFYACEKYRSGWNYCSTLLLVQMAAINRIVNTIILVDISPYGGMRIIDDPIMLLSSSPVYGDIHPRLCL
jgi:hypothetical protein